MKKKKSGGGGANWMDTYGDMVTLLLCFFVLLYSMSTISEDKWKAIVQSFNPNSIQDPAPVDGGNEGPLADPFDGIGAIDDPDLTQEEKEAMQEAVDAALQELYERLQQYAAESGQADAIEVTKGDGYVFISFNDAIFFNGDSAVLREDGKAVLDVVAEALNGAAPYIDEVRILGHTAQGDPNIPNRVEVDRNLASNRATAATIYIQERTVISPARLVSVGYGQHRPVDLNDTEEHRAHNRRVEILITGLDLLNQLGDSIQQYSSLRAGTDNGNSDGGASSSAPAE